MTSAAEFRRISRNQRFRSFFSRFEIVRHATRLSAEFQHRSLRSQGKRKPQVRRHLRESLAQPPSSARFAKRGSLNRHLHEEEPAAGRSPRSDDNCCEPVPNSWPLPKPDEEPPPWARRIGEGVNGNCGIEDPP